MIAGLGQAAQLVTDNVEEYGAHMREVRDYLEEQLEVSWPLATHNLGCLANLCNFHPFCRMYSSMKFILMGSLLVVNGFQTHVMCQLLDRVCKVCAQGELYVCK